MVVVVADSSGDSILVTVIIVILQCRICCSTGESVLVKAIVMVCCQ